MFKKKEKESAFLKNASMGLLFEKNDIDGRDDDNNSNDNDIDEYNDDDPDQVNTIPDHNNDESNNNGGENGGGVDDNMMYDDLIHSLPVPPSTGGTTTGTTTSTTTTTASRVIPSKQKKRYNLDPTVLLTPSDKHKSVSVSSSTNNLHKQQQQQIPNIINDSDIAFLIQCNQKCSDDDYMMKPIVSSEDGFTLKCEMHSERLDLNHSESRGMVIVRSVGVVPYQLCDVVNSVMDTSLPQTLSLVNVPVDYYSTSSDNNNNSSKRYSTTATSSNLSPYSISVSRMTMTFTDNGGNNNNNSGSSSSSSELMNNNNNKIDAEEMSKRRRSSVMKNASSILQYSSHQVSSPSSASPSSSSLSSSSSLHRAALMNSQLPQSSSVGIDGASGGGGALGQQFLFSVPIVLDYCVASSAVYDSIHNRFITLHKSCSHPKAKPLANNHSVIRSSLFTGTIYEAVGQTSDEHMTRYTTITLVRTQDFFNKKRNVRRAFETQAMEMYADLINKCRANHARGFIAPKRVAGMYSTLLDYERNCLDKSLQEKRNPWDTYNQSTEYF